MYSKRVADYSESIKRPSTNMQSKIMDKNRFLLFFANLKTVGIYHIYNM